MATAIITLVLALVALRQLTALAKTSASQERRDKARFIYEIQRAFFKKETRQLMFLVEQDLLKFHADEQIPYFSVVKRDIPGIDDRLEDIGISYSRVSMNFVDDALLGPFEDVAIFWRTDLLTIEDAYAEFDYYVTECMENKEMLAYIRYCQGSGDEAYSGIYGDLPDLAKALAAERQRRKGQRHS